jgi:hypothetical protein
MIDGVNEATTAAVNILKNNTTAILTGQDMFQKYSATYISRTKGQIILSCVVSLSASNTITIEARTFGTHWYVDYDNTSSSLVKASLTIEKL